MTDDLLKAGRLTQEHEKAIKESSLKFEKWNSLKKEYEDLRTTLTTLPQKLEHHVMVPVGSVGMFPGKLIHTNEIMVLLGENWFAQCTAYKAVEIINHRLKILEKNLEDVSGEINFLGARKKMAEDVLTLDKNVKDMVDIREEEKTSTAERKGKKRIAHKAKHDVVPRSMKDLDKGKLEKQSSGATCSEQDPKGFSVDELFARLDELEMAERFENLEGHESKMKEAKVKNTVKFEEDDASGMAPKGEIDNARNCIRFNHTNHERTAEAAEPSISQDQDLPSSSSTSNGQTTTAEETQTFISPADIYKLFAKPLVIETDEKPLKSILKKERKYSNEGMKQKSILKHSPEHKSDPSSGDEASGLMSTEEPKPILKGTEAISSNVVERQVGDTQGTGESEVTEKKPMSRFKASRIKK
eukprot:Seg1660.7 transcript_id=Seg1660.7/GoldUCD/mRNA.D3Y31 product="Unconventional prefoldin RPB5 interactor" protein_id=Seg1660.7/GoldUCD/D3Y31